MAAAQKTVLITGASGLLGRAIFQEFSRSKEWNTIGTAYARVKEGLIRLDLNNVSEIEKSISKIKPSVVIHCAAERRPDVVENQEEATKCLNVNATKCLIENVAKHDGFMLYISTDYVFDGTAAPYKPKDKASPLNKYGESKLAGEVETLKFENHGAVLRVPVLYGRVERLHESVVTGLYDWLVSNEKRQVSDYELRYPTLVDDIAVACHQIADRHVNGTSFCGIWHFSGADELTKYGMIREMVEVFGCSHDHITGVKEPSSGAKRPYNCQLDCSDLHSKGIDRITPFKLGIKMVIEDFKNSL